METQLVDVYVFDPADADAEVLGVESSVEMIALSGLLEELTSDGYTYRVVDQITGVILADNT